MRQLDYIVLHCSGVVVYGEDAATIDKWHRQQGFDSIGYHYVVLDDCRDEPWRDGELQLGRPVHETGAHCRGLNANSIGVCVIGDGDLRTFTAPQWLTVMSVCMQLIRRYGISVDKVIGHREVNDLIDIGELPREYATEKTCPGAANSMAQVRGCLESLLNH